VRIILKVNELNQKDMAFEELISGRIFGIPEVNWSFNDLSLKVAPEVRIILKVNELNQKDMAFEELIPSRIFGIPEVN
jgi:hypothetical protein